MSPVRSSLRGRCRIGHAADRQATVGCEPHHVRFVLHVRRQAPRGRGDRMHDVLSDIGGSTTLAEGMSPAEYHGLLDRFYTTASTVVFDPDGAVDKFVGNELVALFFPLLSGEHQRPRASRPPRRFSGRRAMPMSAVPGCRWGRASIRDPSRSAPSAVAHTRRAHRRRRWCQRDGASRLEGGHGPDPRHHRGRCGGGPRPRARAAAD